MIGISETLASVLIHHVVHGANASNALTLFDRLKSVIGEYSDSSSRPSPICYWIALETLRCICSRFLSECVIQHNTQLIGKALDSPVSFSELLVTAVPPNFFPTIMSWMLVRCVVTMHVVLFL